MDLVADRDFFPWAESVFRAVAPWTAGVPHIERSFLTARVEIRQDSELLRLDLAGFRGESYPAPGALPQVCPGSFEDDARRRDFPVNALYLEWNPQKKIFSRLLDPFAGEADLARRQFSLIRPEAFREDPTRIFRWARLAGRLGFSSSPALDASLRKALGEPSLWREVGVARVAAEMDRLQRESNPLASTRLLFSSGVFSSLTAKALSRLSPGRLLRLRRWVALRDLLETIGQEERAWAGASREMFFLALLSGLRRPVLERAAASLGVGSRLRKTLLEALFHPASWPGGRSYEGFIECTGGDRGRMMGFADRMSTEKVLYSLLRCTEEELDLWREYLGEGRNLPPLIGGEVLLHYPAIAPDKRKSLLAEIRFRQRTGELRSRAEAVDWIEASVSNPGSTDDPGLANAILP